MKKKTGEFFMIFFLHEDKENLVEWGGGYEALLTPQQTKLQSNSWKNSDALYSAVILLATRL